MAAAVKCALARHKHATTAALVATLFLGIAFLSIKAAEYKIEFDERLIPAINFHYDGVDPQHVELFMVFYFFMTMLHAAHMLVGLSLVTFLIIRIRCGEYVAEGKNSNAVEIIGLYWHFVDLVWIFLFPLLYLVK